MSERMTNMEEKLNNVETLLRQLLAHSGIEPAIPAAVEDPDPEPESEPATLQRQNTQATYESTSSYSNNTSEEQPNPHDYASSPPPIPPPPQSPPASSGYMSGNNDTPRRPVPGSVPPPPENPEELEKEEAAVAELEKSDKDYLNELKVTIAEQEYVLLYPLV